MSKQLALAVSMSVLATVALALFGVDPAMQGLQSGSGANLIRVEAPALPGVSQMLPSLN